MAETAHRHPHLNFFAADIFDDLLVKDDIASMEHPMFSLSTKPDLRELRYENNGVSIVIIPSKRGLPTIHDKDVLLYCGSLLMEQINKGITPPRKIRFSTRDLLVTTNRTTCGTGYKHIKEAMERLAGALITTDIRTKGRRKYEGFHILEKFRIIEKSRIDSRMAKVEVTLSDWLYDSLIEKEVLTINRGYFHIRKPLERRLYEIARKHCGSQPQFKINLDKLQKKTGSTSAANLFRFNIRKAMRINQLPDYNISLDNNDVVQFSQKKHTDDDSKLEQTNTDSVNFKIRPDTIERVRDLVQQHNLTRKSGQTGYDFYALLEDYKYQLVTGKFKSDNVDAAFYGFIRKKLGIES